MELRQFKYLTLQILKNFSNFSRIFLQSQISHNLKFLNNSSKLPQFLIKILKDQTKMRTKKASTLHTRRRLR